MEKEFVKDNFARPSRTRTWTEMDVLKKILFELRKIAEILESQKKVYRYE
jgi:hypothetical protein